MARGITGGSASLGRALAHAVADAVSHVLNATAPHQQEAKTRGILGTLHHVANESADAVAPIAQRCLDTGEVHPLLEPVLRLMAGKE